MSTTELRAAEGQPVKPVLPLGAVAGDRRRVRLRPFERLCAYLELAKVRVNALVLLIAAVGFALAAQGPIDLALLALCLVGTALLGAGGSALNQYVEREFDGRMPRTEHRPLPRKILHPLEALSFGLAAAICGTLVLALLVGPLASVLGAATFLMYVTVYTPLKRRTPHALFVGAVPGAMPPLIGWAAAGGELPPAAWAIFSIVFVWQVPHFLAIAVVYRDDYRVADFPTFPALDPDGRPTARLLLVSSAMLLVVSLVPIWFGFDGAIYRVGASALGAGFLCAAIWCARELSRARARVLIHASVIYLPLLFVLLLAEKLR